MNGYSLTTTKRSKGHLQALLSEEAMGRHRSTSTFCADGLFYLLLKRGFTSLLLMPGQYQNFLLEDLSESAWISW